MKNTLKILFVISAFSLCIVQCVIVSGWTINANNIYQKALEKNVKKDLTQRAE